MSSLQTPGHYRNQCRQLKEETDQNDANKNSACNNNNSNNDSGQTNSNTHNNKTVSNGSNNIPQNRNDRKPRTVYQLCETCGKTNHSTEKCSFGANAADRLPLQNRRPMEQSENQQQETQINIIEIFQAVAQAFNQERHVFTPLFHLIDRKPLKRQDCHQFLRLSGSNPQKHLSTNTN